MTTVEERPRPDGGAPARRRTTWSLWTLLALAGVGTAVYAAWPYLSPDPASGPLPLNPDIALHRLSVVVHALPGAVALLIGPFQFLTVVRVRYPRAHRIAGRIYLGSVVVAAIAAYFAAAFSVSGFPAQVAFVILATAWLATLTCAYRAIRRGDVRRHRIWMVRNYSLTFAAATLRLYLVVGILLLEPLPTISFPDVYVVAVWASILINVLVAEYVILHRMELGHDGRNGLRSHRRSARG